MPRITAGTKIQLTLLLLLSLLLPLLLSAFCDSEMCLWGKCHGRSKLALLDILPGPCSTQYSGSWFSPLSVGIFLPRTYAFISLSWFLKRGPERNKEKNYSNWGVFMGRKGAAVWELKVHPHGVLWILSHDESWVSEAPALLSNFCFKDGKKKVKQTSSFSLPSTKA